MNIEARRSDSPQKETTVSRSSQDAQREVTNIAGSSKDDRSGTRRWYHPRPSPRCAADVAGFNYTYWLGIVLIVILLLIP